VKTMTTKRKMSLEKVIEISRTILDAGDRKAAVGKIKELTEWSEFEAMNLVATYDDSTSCKVLASRWKRAGHPTAMHSDLSVEEPVVTEPVTHGNPAEAKPKDKVVAFAEFQTRLRKAGFVNTEQWLAEHGDDPEALANLLRKVHGKPEKVG
jgi:hypothetical protein